VNGYERLLELARETRDLIGAGRWEELTLLGWERERVRAELPRVPPPEAAPLIAEIARLTEESERLLIASMRRLEDTLRRIQEGRSAISAYLPGHERSDLDAVA
jgi:hypothetical protein